MQENTSSGLVSVAFLFAADHPGLNMGGRYSDPCEQALLQAIGAHHDSVPARIRILRGDVPIHELASRLKRIEASPPKPGSRINRGVTRVVGADRSALMTVVGDLVDSFREQWTTLDVVEAPGVFGGTNVYCLTTCQMTTAGAALVDEELSRLPYYHGAVALDPGNPAHVELFSLLECAYLEWPTLYLSEWECGEGSYEFGVASATTTQVVVLPYVMFQQKAPPGLTLGPLSSRGKATARRLASVVGDSHHSRIATELERTAIERAITHAIDMRVDVPESEQVVVPVAKLVKYALNPEHEKGKHKARIFRDELGIVDRHWRFLAWQLIEALPTATFERVDSTEHGIQYRALIQVVGINGASKTVESGWIIRSGGSAEMITAYVAEKKFQRDDLAVMPPWVHETIEGEERFAEVYALADDAGRKAAAACVPVPMKIVGFPVELEGQIGGAYIQFGGRGPFARWLVNSGHAVRSERKGGGVELYVTDRSQSAARAKAYAAAFQRVLWLNGIDGSQIHSYLT